MQQLPTSLPCPGRSHVFDPVLSKAQSIGGQHRFWSLQALRSFFIEPSGQAPRPRGRARHPKLLAYKQLENEVIHAS
jgi:hypothetical protein